MAKKKVLIIIWKWIAFRDNIVTNELLASPEYRDFESRIGDWKGTLYDEYRVWDGDSANVGNEGQPEEQGLVVRAFIRTGKLTTPFLNALIAHYSAGAEVIVFLHRNEGYTPDFVTTILGATTAIKCFLFSGGYEGLYYDSEENLGLLGEHGDFFMRPPTKDSGMIKIADRKAQTIDPHVFSKTWDYYKYDYHSSFFSLKEDFLMNFLSFDSIHELWPTKKWRNCLCKNSKLLREIDIIVNITKNSPLFSFECAPNLEGQLPNSADHQFEELINQALKKEEMAAPLKDLRSYFIQLFFEDNSGEKLGVHDHLQHVSELFDELLKVSIQSR